MAFEFLSLLFAPLLLIASAFAQHESTKRPTPLPLPFRLQGDGYACSGYLKVTERQFVWKSSFTLCQASSWISSEKDGVWIFKLKQTPAQQKECRTDVVTMEHTFPGQSQDIWEVDRIITLESFRKNPDHADLACPGMQR